MNIADKTVVSNQYASSSKLETRISIHEKYSRNKQPFGEWVVSHYQLKEGEKILELGCGTGSMWQYAVLPAGCHITLTDLSPGMLEAARKQTPRLQADYAVCDAMSLPYMDYSFDVIIANMMLYHVPDISQALKEIRRVLKPEGRFYAATFGVHGVTEAVFDMLQLPCTANHRFTLQNGTAILSSYFKEVCIDTREDALDVTDILDLITYLRSMAGMINLADVPDGMLTDTFNSHMKNGVLSLPKEYGLFICTGYADHR